MADDVRRTFDELVALLPDNYTGKISPQDIRDFLISVHTEKGGHKNGFADYGDLATASSPIVVPADVMTKLTCDGLGATTRETRKLPNHADPYWDTANNRVDLSQFELDTIIKIRLDVQITTTGTNTGIVLTGQFYNSLDAYIYSAEKRLSEVKAAATISEVSEYTFYIGEAIVGGSLDINITCTNNSTVVVNGVAIFAWAGGND